MGFVSGGRPSVNLFETEAQARGAFSRIARSLRGRPILGCLYEAESVRHGPTIERVSASYFLIGKQFPRLADETWRQQYEVRIEGGTEKTWIDIVLLRADRAIAVAFFSSEEGKPFPLPLSNDFVQRIAQRLAGRLSG